MIRKLSHLVMCLPVIVAAAFCFSGSPTKAIPMDHVHALTEDEIAMLLEASQQTQVAESVEVVEGETEAQ